MSVSFLTSGAHGHVIYFFWPALGWPHLHLDAQVSSYGGFYPGFHLQKSKKEVSSASWKFDGSYLCDRLL